MKKQAGRSYFVSALAYFKTSLFCRAVYFVVPSLNLIYTRIPKAASTKIVYELMKKIQPSIGSNLSDFEINTLAPSYSLLSFPAHVNKLISFSVVRNPFHRMVAVYREFFMQATEDNFIYENYLLGILKRDMDFKTFVDTIETIPDFLKEQHFKPQSYILKQVKMNTTLQVFRLEAETDLLFKFFNNFDLDTPTQEESSKGYDYRLFYTLETALKVKSIYQQDIVEFGYHDVCDDLLNSIKSRS